MTNPKRKGTLLFQFLALLALASFLTIALLKIHAHNTQFSNGTVRVEWNEKAHQFILKAYLPNGHTKEDTLIIQFVK